MSIIHRSAVVNYSASEMFELVNAVEDYPKFLPWCKSSQVHKRTVNEVGASLELAMGAIHRRFTTCNRIHKDKIIEIRLIDGPFRHLEGFWRFESMAGLHSRVVFDLEFEFNNRVAALAFDAIFQQVANSLVQAFVERAEEIYGKR